MPGTISRGVMAVVWLCLGSLVACEGSLRSSCEVGERTYPDGAQWTCTDGCNSCGCSDGTILSTAKGCPTPPGPAAGKLMCEGGGSWHTHGDTWTTEDGCELSCDDGKLVGDCG